MRNALIFILVALCSTGASTRPAQAPAGYFPSPARQPQLLCFNKLRVFPLERKAAIDPFMAAWFSQHLSAAHEPSLYRMATPAMPAGTGALRFTWLRSFHPPVIVRIGWQRNGAARLVATELSGAGGYEPGTVRRRVDRPLTRREAMQVRDVLLRTRALTLPTVECGSGLDGAEWIVESATGAGYRVLARWTPQRGGIRALGLAMLRLTGWRFGEVY